MRTLILMSLLGLSACKQSYSLYDESYNTELKQGYGPDLVRSFYGDNALKYCEQGKVLYQTCINHDELKEKGSTKIVFDCNKGLSFNKSYISQLTCRKEYVFIF